MQNITYLQLYIAQQSLALTIVKLRSHSQIIMQLRCAAGPGFTLIIVKLRSLHSLSLEMRSCSQIQKTGSFGVIMQLYIAQGRAREDNECVEGTLC
jgi:hypothetical protein